MSFWSKFFIALAITILATTGAVVGVFAGQKEQIDMGGSIKYTVPYFTVEFLNYDDTVFETQQVAYGQDATKPATDPTRPGYTFKSWTDYTNITKDRRVTANWIKNEAYLTTGPKWQAIVTSSAVGANSNIEQIEFVSSVPSGATLIGSVGVTNETATTVWTEDCGVFDVKAYYTALSSGKYKISFYSPYTIYAPTDSSSLFEDLTSLTSINFTNFATNYVTDMSGMFMNCSSLTSLNVTGFVTTNVTTMDSMFSSCSSLTSLDVSKFSTANVKYFSRMFTFCSSIKSFNLSNFSTQSATEMLAMFNECSSLTSLNISSFNTSKVTDMYGMFINCSSLTSLDISSFDMTKVESAERMLDGCTALTKINTPKTIGSTAVDLPTETNYSWFDQANTNNAYTQITSACINKTLVLRENNSYLRKDWTTALTNNNANFKKANIKTIQFVKSVPSGSGYTQVSVGATTSAGTPAFVSGTAGVVNITAYVKANSSDSTKYDVIFYSPVTIYAPVNSSYLFSELTALNSINFGNFNTSNVTNMSYMFWGCTILTTLNVSNFNTSNVTDMSYMFCCDSLTSLNLSNFDTSNVTNMGYMFCDAGSLTYLNVSNFNTSNVTNMKNMFSFCWKLTDLDISNFSTNNVINMESMFSGCSQLTNVEILNFNTSKVTDMSGMFINCSSLTELNLSSFDMSKVTDTSNMLSYCSALTEIKTPKAIGSAAVALPTKTGYSWVDQANTNNLGLP